MEIIGIPPANTFPDESSTMDELNQRTTEKLVKLIHMQYEMTNQYTGVIRAVRTDMCISSKVLEAFEAKGYKIYRDPLGVTIAW